MSDQQQQAMDTRYADAINDALERTAADGPLWGPGMAAHAPMAAEALAALGRYDEVPRWIERYRTDHRYSVRPDPRTSLDPEDTAEHAAALGKFGRFTDWATMFKIELAERPWRKVVERWWPRLLPGMSGILGHGLIRTAHAIRGVHSVAAPTPAQLHELAQGLALWAASYQSMPAASPPALVQAPPAPAPAQARHELVTATGKIAGMLADRAPEPAIQLVHAVTIPMAVDMVLPVLPVASHPDAYHHSLAVSGALLTRFGRFLPPARGGNAPDAVPNLPDAVEAAVETGDEHAIKMAEVCVRSAARHSDNVPFVRAVGMLVHQLVKRRATPTFLR